MKVTTKAGVVATLILASGLAQADWSVNLGYASEYYYRGIFQKNSSANGGINFEAGGFYAGTWAADVGDGLEVDGFFGYGMDLGEIGLSAGYTGYFYTGDFDDTYQEINLGGSFGIASLDVAVGQYENFEGPTLDYTYYALTLEQNGLYGKYAGFSQDFDGSYLELGYGATVADIDFGIVLIINDEDLNGTDGNDENVIFTVGKTFDLQ
ncbi:MAG TPA: TorF family putative porin [Woeseiaceae bacterium]|nr:TorF family putative porin [Woeseiaceae bacterium]